MTKLTHAQIALLTAAAGAEDGVVERPERAHKTICTRRSKSRPLERRRFAAAGGVKPGQW